MKKLVLIVAIALLTSVSGVAQEINWVSFEEALELQKKTPKKIMMDVYTVWCGPCKMLDKNTFHNADVAEYVNENYYAVKFNGEGNEVVKYKDKTFTNPNYKAEYAKRRNSAHELTRYFQISGYPTVLFLDEKADVIFPSVGYINTAKLELYLKLFKNDDHKNIKTQDEFTEYCKTFKYEFKG